jgi:hypothetical protein
VLGPFFCTIISVKRSYRAYLSSAAWKKKAKTVREYYHYKCAVCDLDYRKRHVPIHVHHLYYTRYRRSLLGREHPCFHLRLLCADHHPKGKLSADSIRLWRKAYRFQKRGKWFFDFLQKFSARNR